MVYVDDQHASRTEAVFFAIACEDRLLDQLKTQPALIDQVHDQLVAAISSGRLVPGQRLTQERVAEMLGVSRQPVSHALQLLKHRGLVIEHGKRGLAVAPLDGTRIRQLYQVREALDGLAARLAAVRIREGGATEDEVARVKHALDRGQQLSADCSAFDLVRADVAFHRSLYDLSGNPEIAQTVAEQWPQFMRSMAVVLEADGERQKIWHEHGAIVEAVLAGDAEAAEDHARHHTARAGEDTATRVGAQV